MAELRLLGETDYTVREHDELAAISTTIAALIYLTPVKRARVMRAVQKMLEDDKVSTWASE